MLKIEFSKISPVPAPSVLCTQNATNKMRLLPDMKNPRPFGRRRVSTNGFGKTGLSDEIETSIDKRPCRKCALSAHFLLRRFIRKFYQMMLIHVHLCRAPPPPIRTPPTYTSYVGTYTPYVGAYTSHAPWAPYVGTYTSYVGTYTHIHLPRPVDSKGRPVDSKGPRERNDFNKIQFPTKMLIQDNC